MVNIKLHCRWVFRNVKRQSQSLKYESTIFFLIPAPPVPSPFLLRRHPKGLFRDSRRLLRNPRRLPRDQKMLPKSSKGSKKPSKKGLNAFFLNPLEAYLNLWKAIHSQLHTTCKSTPKKTINCIKVNLTHQNFVYIRPKIK